MARIRTYNIDNTINLEDKLIGTDIDDSGATKNYKIGDIKDFVLTFVDSGATGTGTTGFLPIWTDGAAGVLGNSIVKEDAGTAYSTTKTLTVDGVINQINYVTDDAYVNTGDVLAEIVPTGSDLIIEANIDPKDIAYLALGQEVQISLTAYDASKYGRIEGSIKKISADAMVDETNGSTYFEAKVELFENDMMLLGGYELVPGMPADVLVKTGSRTLLGYITSPLNRMFENALIED